MGTVQKIHPHAEATWLSFPELFVGLIVFNSILNGYALSILWEWFIVKKFGLPILSIPEAIGIAMIISYLTHQIQIDKEKNSASETLIKCIAVGTTKPAIALTFGYIVTLFM